MRKAAWQQVAWYTPRSSQPGSSMAKSCVFYSSQDYVKGLTSNVTVQKVLCAWKNGAGLRRHSANTACLSLAQPMHTFGLSCLIVAEDQKKNPNQRTGFRGGKGTTLRLPANSELPKLLQRVTISDRKTCSEHARWSWLLLLLSLLLLLPLERPRPISTRAPPGSGHSSRGPPKPARPAAPAAGPPPRASAALGGAGGPGRAFPLPPGAGGRGRQRSSAAQAGGPAAAVAAAAGGAEGSGQGAAPGAGGARSHRVTAPGKPPPPDPPPAKRRREGGGAGGGEGGRLLAVSCIFAPFRPSPRTRSPRTGAPCARRRRWWRQWWRRGARPQRRPSSPREPRNGPGPPPPD